MRENTDLPIHILYIYYHWCVCVCAHARICYCNLGTRTRTSNKPQGFFCVGRGEGGECWEGAEAGGEGGVTECTLYSAFKGQLLWSVSFLNCLSRHTAFHITSAVTHPLNRHTSVPPSRIRLCCTPLFHHHHTSVPPSSASTLHFHAWAFFDNTYPVCK